MTIKIIINKKYKEIKENNYNIEIDNLLIDTMNLSKRSEDNELFSGVQKKENIENNDIKIKKSKNFNFYNFINNFLINYKFLLLFLIFFIIYLKRYYIL
jgi:hypothetical protein